MVASKIINGSVTGLRIQEELPGQIGVPDPTAPLHEMEPNTYGDWGASIRSLAREPIVNDRQGKKGMVVELNADGGFQTDLTQFGINPILPGFMFADYRPKAESTTVTSTTGADYVGTGMGGFVVDDLVVARNFGNPANNGLKVVSAATGTTVTTTPSPVAEAATPADASLVNVGIQAPSGDIAVDASGVFPALTSSVLDFTSLGWNPGEWVHPGGDAAGTFFTNAVNNGFKRVRSITANRVEFDKSITQMVDEAGGGITLQIFHGRKLKNETGAGGSGADIVRRTYHAERTLGAPDTALPNDIQSEVLIGAVANTLEMTIGVSDKVTLDLGFVALDGEQRTPAQGLLAGPRPDLDDSDAFNTSSDFSMMRITPVDETTGTPLPVFGELLSVSMSLTNNAKPAKAIGSLRAIEIIIGRFMITGEVEAYFSDGQAVNAVRNNTSVTLDMALVKGNAGIIFDLPLITLGEGRMAIEQDEAITLPVTYNAASGSQVSPDLDFTMQITQFDFLPDLAG